MMKEQLRKILLVEAKEVHADLPTVPFTLERPANPEHGEVSTNMALLGAKALKQKPREIADKLVLLLQNQLNKNLNFVESISIAGAGFINFKFKSVAWIESLKNISEQKSCFGASTINQNKKVVLEYVSANPTGPLHIGNARGGPLGDAIASLLKITGAEVTREFYLNDIGGQIDKLGSSIYLRLKAKINQTPVDESLLGYQGQYVEELANKALTQFGKELINRNEAEVVPELGLFGIKELTNEIRRDCADMGLGFESWIYEKDVLSSGKTTEVINALKASGLTIEKEGAVWFVPHDEFINDRECVLVRSDGRPTYFANDIAYHIAKYERGFNWLINIWGSNHHGHVPRVQAAVKALGYDPEKLETVLYQYVRVKRGDSAVKMSKRGGNFVLAREVLDEVGRDALRFFLLRSSPESHLDFDLELAKKTTSENPVYYVQYAHARIQSIFAKAKEASVEVISDYDERFVSLLNLPEEIDLARLLLEYPEEIQKAALDLAPHKITYYLTDLAKAFQHYYDKARLDGRYRFISSDVLTSQAKLYLAHCIQQVLKNGLALLGISAPDQM